MTNPGRAVRAADGIVIKAPDRRITAQAVRPAPAQAGRRPQRNQSGLTRAILQVRPALVRSIILPARGRAGVVRADTCRNRRLASPDASGGVSHGRVVVSWRR